MGTSVVENDRIEEMCLKVGRIRVGDLPEFLVTELKQFLEDISGEGKKIGNGEKIPRNAIAQFEMLLKNPDFPLTEPQ